MVVNPLRILGLSWNTNLEVPVVSLTSALICVEVVELNTARVSEVIATLPPCLKLTVISCKLLSDVNRRSLCTLSSLASLIVSVADDAVEMVTPLIVVAVAVPKSGLVIVGDVRVLLVRVCVSVSVTNLLSTEPSNDLQYPPLLCHSNCL